MPLKCSSLIWRLYAAARVDPEQNDNTCGLDLQIRSLQFQTLAHPAVRDSGLAASITRKRHLQPHVSVKTRHRCLYGR